MALWLEHRDDKGTLIERARFLNGSVTLLQLIEITDEIVDGVCFSLKEAIALAKTSAHLPVERRDWSLRIDLGIEG